MSNLFYHLTDSQWKKIEFFFRQEKEEDVRRSILVASSTLYCGFSKAERVGETCLLALVIGTVFITNSANGFESVFLKKSYEF